MNQAPKLGLIIAVCIALFVLSALGALISYAPNLNLSQIVSDPYYLHVTKFSFYQALLSTVFSVGLAIPVAHALSRRQFMGKSLLLKLFSCTLVLPVLVGVFGLLAIYGNNGLLAKLFDWFDNELPFSIYGLNGILLAHIFFNLPYASRLLLLSLEGVPIEQHKLCAHLGMGHWYKFKWVEWPRLRQQLPHVCGLVFMLCFTSFATVMALGGGPKSTTIELAIYQAIKFDFDLQAGALLAIWQMLLCGGVSLVIQKVSKKNRLSIEAIFQLIPLTDDRKISQCWDVLWVLLSVLIVLPPLLMVVISGINSKLWQVLQDSQFWQAVEASLSIASLASVSAVFIGICILQTSRIWRIQGRLNLANSIEMMGTIILVTPGLVISTGLFLLLRKTTDVYSLAFFIVVAVNALTALPYVIKTLSEPFFQIVQQYQLLTMSLGMKGWRRFLLIEWRALRKPIAQAFTISFMLSIGDLSAIALFGSQDFKTLPLYLFQLLGSYQMEAAAVVSLVLLLLSVGSFTLVEKLFGRAHAQS
ncbi:thiamine/thiamine pyrophosphate ABC transporter permease ThiP [Vibrio sp. TH_r3]|uniref:thiamine/thiamine pyrophosphate ABC transporter permease ThiP n=1 Tax=Vibrio sp. TH_r3 TaxID=3082084 RepID=UPI002954EC33|nr:thiamine/thiamine pyrophosphate ABC transporter permease ThiP [Vibrio sp. TH_r3]MDV7105635.1 thiamine/thiamine pyrophosphate ABC transporter permease ThiP [Vibrio sp. TH_r3]